jgi:hypothetical protein
VADFKKDTDDAARDRFTVSLEGSAGLTVDGEVRVEEFKTLKKGDKVTLKGECFTDDFDKDAKRVRLRYAFVLKKG